MTADITQMIRRNEEEYADAYGGMKWITPEQIAVATWSRAFLIDSILKQPGAKWEFSDTKLYTHAISPGCRLCGQGDWSCLFINGICNARCFYCPSAQKDDGPPMSHSLSFEHPDEYVGYVNRFQIKGVSFSGGEPFLNFDRVMTFLEAVKTRTDHPVYVWMYTNGILADKGKFQALRSAGLDEIRFDLSADLYRLDALKQALGVIPCVTVEIPAIPEDLPLTKPLLHTLNDMGVNYLNLHQVRCTPYNQKHLSKRGYTFVHGPKVTVLETETTALELMEYALEKSLGLAVNYCSFTYCSQFQGAGARKRYAPVVKTDWEDITRTGHIRRMKLTGTNKDIENICSLMSQAGTDPGLYCMDKNKTSLFFSEKLWPLLDLSDDFGVNLHVSYYSATARPGVSYRFPFKSVSLSENKAIVVEKQPASSPIRMENLAEIQNFRQLLENPGQFQALNNENGSVRHAVPFESVTPGFAQII